MSFIDPVAAVESLAQAPQGSDDVHLRQGPYWEWNSLINYLTLPAQERFRRLQKHQLMAWVIDDEDV